MGHMFSKKKVTRVTDQDRAVLQLKKQRDQLRSYQRRIQSVMEKDRNIARRLLQEGNRERAKLLLKKKRHQETLLIRTEGLLENLELMVHDVEFAQINLQVMEGLQQGNEALKQMNSMLSMEDVERILEETQEGVEKQRELDALLLGFSLTGEEEEDVNRELDELVGLELPEVPSEPLPERYPPTKVKGDRGRVALTAS
ncbi:unnamed protein product [Darwinula stevensoni]|uniref:Charged multivesicular body protein 6 n=1 Tax=Darwinula stevensoni TaxID=69355 RepID=A0A7R8ZXN5_9CRUS|nr:unnamed protein product [Darwinula stevensoni]CAG0879734.1 unnamed protein product [Darwinula stevensoni]